MPKTYKSEALAAVHEMMEGLHESGGIDKRTSREFDLLDPAVRSCFDTPDRCRLLVFPLGGQEPDGMMAAHAAPAGQASIVLLLRRGRVAYKAMNGA